MRLGKTSWLVIAIGITVITFASLGMARTDQVSERAALADELAIAENRLTNLQLRDLHNQKAGLEEQVTAAREAAATFREDISRPLESIEYTDELFDISDNTSVQITEITEREPRPDSLSEVDCELLPVTVHARGPLDNLISFVAHVNTDLTTGVVQTAEINIPGADEESQPSAVIQINIYGYEGE